MPRSRSAARAARVAAAALALALAALPPAPRPATRAPESPEGPSDWFYAQRVWPGTAIPQARVRAEIERLRLERAGGAGRFAATGATSALTWQQVGPLNIGGRVTAIAAAPGGSPAYCGSANGGIFRSLDGGANWTAVTDAYSFFSIGALTLNPLNPATVWCGTGESNASLDSYDGNGLWVSRDAGQTWVPSGLAATARIAAVAVSPVDSNTIYVGAMGTQFTTGPDRGFYRSADGGRTWTKTLFVSDSTGVCDVAVDPAHPETVYCATWERVRRLTYRRAFGPECGVWRSFDGGRTWARLAGGLPAPGDNVGRIGLAVAPSLPSRLYAMISSGATGGYTGLGVWRSDDGGTTWTKEDSGTTFRNSFGGSSGFAWYFGRIAVDPTNANVVWTCGTLLLRSSDGGVTWADMTGSSHVDHHAFWFDPLDATHLYLGNDGGFWAARSGGAWGHAVTLPISQFYAGSVAATNPGKLVGGTQDNGSLQAEGGPSSWGETLGGDGFYNLVDPLDATVTFAEWQYCCDNSGPRRITSDGLVATSPSGFNSADRYNWCTPVVMSPRNHNLLLTGSQRVYRSTNGGLSYAAISPDLTTDPVAQVVYGTITTLAISNADTSCYYAGTDDGRVWRSQTRGVTWENVTAGLPGRYVTRVTADPADPQVVYVCLSGFGLDDHAPHVFRSTDRGTTWLPVDGNLPDAPANDLVVDPADTNTLYAATDMGVFITRNLGSTWWALGAGMPLEPVFSLTLHAASRQLFAFTHGRSAWKLDLTALPLAAGPPPPPTALALSAPRPNPAAGPVRLDLDLPRAAAVEATVYDPAGRRVRVLARGVLAAGRHPLAWDGADERGTAAPAGVYFVRASAVGEVRSQRLVRVR